ncbi:MAG: hypothetical protein RBU29_08810 [bacterium]|jgi:hypothetical protein|nr:hypothetical protein [bacterium]
MKTMVSILRCMGIGLLGMGAVALADPVLSPNLLLNPGAESELEGWVNLAGTLGVSSEQKYNGANSFDLGWDEAAEQNVDVSVYANEIDSGNTEAIIGAWVYTQYSFSEVTLRLKYFDDFGFEIGQWEQSQIKSYRIWGEYRYRTAIPTKTRRIAFVIKSSYEQSFLDGLLFHFYYTPLAPTATPTPVDVPTPTVTPIPQVTPSPTPSGMLPAARYTFSEGSAAANHLLYFTPGAPGDFALGDVAFRPLLVQSADGPYTDGFGISVTLDPGEGVTFYASPLPVGEDYVYLRIGVWSSSPTVSLALGALDAKPSDSLATAEINGTIEFNLMLGATRFVQKFGALEAFYKSERGAVVPVFQVVNGGTDACTVQFDTLEIFRIPPTMLPIARLQ